MRLLLNDCAEWFRKKMQKSTIVMQLFAVELRSFAIMLRKSLSARQCQQGTAPLYLREYCQPLSSVVSRQRRSAHSGRLTVPRTRTNYGDRSFAVQGPRTWNSLPADLRAPDISVETFRHKLKTFLFAVWLSIRCICCITRFCAI